MKNPPRGPHSEPHFIAVVRSPQGKKYHRCNTFDQALAHTPYLIEEINGYGQVVRRVNFERSPLKEMVLQVNGPESAGVLWP